jgi:hypothetical protein
MHNILDMAMSAFSGTPALVEGIIIAVIAALIMGRFIFVIIWAAIAVIIDSFLPVVYGVVTTGKTDGIAAKATEVVNLLQSNWTLVAVKYGVYLIVISVLFLLKSAVFRRG